MSNKIMAFMAAVAGFSMAVSINRESIGFAIINTALLCYWIGAVQNVKERR